MHDLHPAACTDCCKRFVNAHRRLPESVEDWQFVAHEASLFVMYFVAASLSLPFFVANCIFGTRKPRKNELPDRVLVRQYGIDYVPGLTSAQERTLHSQHLQLDALGRRFRTCDRKDKARILSELATAQYIHEKYAEQLGLK